MRFLRKTGGIRLNEWKYIVPYNCPWREQSDGLQDEKEGVSFSRNENGLIVHDIDELTKDGLTSFGLRSILHSDGLLLLCFRSRKRFC